MLTAVEMGLGFSLTFSFGRIFALIEIFGRPISSFLPFCFGTIVAREDDEFPLLTELVFSFLFD